MPRCRRPASGTIPDAWRRKARFSSWPGESVGETQARPELSGLETRFTTVFAALAFVSGSGRELAKGLGMRGMEVDAWDQHHRPR